MLPDCYYGAYARFDTISKKDAAILLGSNCIIGDVFKIEFKPLKGQTRAWVVNDYGDVLGYLDEQISHQLNLLAAKSWEMHAVLSFVAFTDQPEPGFYWGEVAKTRECNRFWTPMEPGNPRNESTCPRVTATPPFSRNPAALPT